MGPIVRVFQDLCTIEAALSQLTGRSELHVEEGKLLLDGDCTVNVKNLRTAMGIGLRLLCSCNTIITQ